MSEYEFASIVKVQASRVYGDDTQDFSIGLTYPMNVKQFIDELMRTFPEESGVVQIRENAALRYPNFDEPRCEYKQGTIEFNSIPKDKVSSQILQIWGHGNQDSMTYVIDVW